MKCTIPILVSLICASGSSTSVPSAQADFVSYRTLGSTPSPAAVEVASLMENMASFGESTTTTSAPIDALGLYFTPTDTSFFHVWVARFATRLELPDLDGLTPLKVQSLLAPILLPDLSDAPTDLVVRSMITMQILDDLGQITVTINPKFFQTNGKEADQCANFKMVIPRIKVAWQSVRAFSDEAGVRVMDLLEQLARYSCRIKPDWFKTLLALSL